MDFTLGDWQQFPSQLMETFEDLSCSVVPSPDSSDWTIKVGAS